MDDQTFHLPGSPEQPESEPTVQKKSGTVLESVEGDIVQVNLCTVNQMNANTVHVNESQVHNVSAQTVNVVQGSLGVAHGASINISGGSVGICSATEAVVDGNAGVMIGQSVTLNNHRTGLVLTREVNGGSIQAVICLAGRTNAPVETIVDQRSVALFGIATGIAMGLVFSLFRILKR